jgi:hypothetical protein
VGAGWSDQRRREEQRLGGRFRQRSEPESTLRLYRGFQTVPADYDDFHDLLNDVGKAVVMADIVGWLNARI